MKSDMGKQSHLFSHLLGQIAIASPAARPHPSIKCSTAKLKFLIALLPLIHLTKRMLYLAQFYIAEGSFDRLKKRALGLMTKNGGSIDRSTLLNRLHIDAQLFKRLILTLHMGGIIEEEWISEGKVVYTLKKAS